MNREMPRGKWLTVKEQAENTGLCESWIYHHKEAGTLPWDVHPRGRKWVADSADIDDWIEATRIPAGGKVTRIEVEKRR
jgi:predicted DNA-binding transcriptional regulator AlpA